MFTGIIERVCRVAAVAPGAAAAGTDALRLEVDLADLATGLADGASVAINGVCLTLAARRGSVAAFDVVPETVRLTSLPSLRPGAAVNVERSLRIGDRIDGHFVQGHVDGVGEVARVQRAADDYRLWVRVYHALLPCIVLKGAVAVDGVSLTIAGVEGREFGVALVPTTLARTTLGERRIGDAVNVETDVLAKIVVSRLEALGGGAASADTSLTWERLQESGFLP